MVFFDIIPCAIWLANFPWQAWRLLSRSFMTQNPKSLLAYTPMLHARLFMETQKFRDHHFQPTRSGLATSHRDCNIPVAPSYLDGHPTFDRPLFVQFCANNPDELLEAAQYVQPYCDAVDLNLGCPQGIARKGRYGAFLQEDWELVYKLINKLHLNLHVPVTAKMRILETREKTLQYAKVIVSAGASIITIHGRQRDQKGHKTGLADWSVIRYLREQLPPEVVIFANGNVLQHEDVQNCITATGADGVMSAEGNLYDPTIFALPPRVGEEGHEYWRGQNGKGGYRMDAVLRRYMDIIYEHVLEESPPNRKPIFLPSDPIEESAFTEKERTKRSIDFNEEPPMKKQKKDKSHAKPTSPNLLAMQAHFFHLLRPLVAKHTNIRDALAKCRAGDVPAFEKVLQMTETAVREGLLDYETNPAKYDDSKSVDEKTVKANEEKDETSLATVRACKRPWWICQPYVRPLPKEAVQNGSLTLSKKDKRKLDEEKAVNVTVKKRVQRSEREDLDLGDGVPEQEMPQQAMVSG